MNYQRGDKNAIYVTQPEEGSLSRIFRNVLKRSQMLSYEGVTNTSSPLRTLGGGTTVVSNFPPLFSSLIFGTAFSWRK